MPSQNEIRSEITSKIIAALEAGTIPWRRPWRVSPNTGRPTSVSTGRPYSGINPLLLELHRLAFGFESKWWATYKQWESLGGRVKHRPADVQPGAWGCHVVFYRPVEKVVTDPRTGQEKEDRFFVLKSYVVFNADQIEGEAVDRFRVVDEPATGLLLPDFEPAERLIAATGAEITYGGDRAYYRNPLPVGTWPNHQTGDYIRLPRREKFASAGAFYETALHEIAHWTQPRLGWDSRANGRPMTELCAEMAACFLSAELGVPNGEALESHAAYLKSWLDAMANDPKFIFRASTQASKITDYLMSFVRQAEAQPVVEEEAA